MSTASPPATTRAPVLDPGARAPWWSGPWPAVVLGGALFLNSLPNELVYDDVHRITDNQRIRALTNFRAIWLQDWTKTSLEGFERWQPNRDLMYRPFVDFTTAVNYALHRLEPWGFRLGNVLLHGLTCLLVWHFTQRLWQDRTTSAWTALLFAVHPIHCEAVVYIVGRAELLAAMFLLAGLLVLVPRTGLARPPRALLAAPLFLLALLSKESAICYIPVALLVLYALRERAPGVRSRWWLAHVGVLLLPLVVYTPMRYVALGQRLARSKPFSMLNPLVDADLVGRIITPFTIVGHYVRLFLWPARLSTEYGLAVIDPKAGPNAMTWLGVLAAAGLLLGLTGYLRRGATWRRVATLCAIWLVSYFLISNTLILFATTLAERLMYWPSVVVFIVLAMAGVGVARRAAIRGRLRPQRVQACGVVVGLVVLVALGTRSVVRNADWATAIGLFAKDAATYPENAQLHANAAQEYFLRALDQKDEARRRHDLETADRYYAKALDIFPRHWGFLACRADILARLGRLDEAIVHARLAVQLNPRDAVLHTALAEYLVARGRYAEAVPYARQAYALQPSDLLVQLVLAEALLTAGQRTEGLALFRRLYHGLPPEHPLRGQIERRLLAIGEPPTTRGSNSP